VIAQTAIIYPGVQLGRDVTIEDYCIIGAPYSSDANEPTIIGDGAVIRSHTVIYAGNKIGKKFQTGNKTNIRERNEIGDNVSIGSLSVVEHHVRIEDDVRIHSQAFVPEYSHLRKASWIGPNVVLTNAKLPRSRSVKDNLRGPEIGAFAMIGANSTILPGIKIGEKALIGAGSVVTKDVSDRVVVAGNPARLVGNIDLYKEYD
jgi:acetyltransferase-like isoleucine patch superfamily enzyme